MNSPKNILVIGATGYVGSYLVPALLADGHHVVASSRSLTTLKQRPWCQHPNLSLKTLDLSKGCDLGPYLVGIDCVYYLVHGMNSGKDFYQYELDMAHHLSRALSRSDVSRVVYLGATLPDSELSTHLAARKATGNILRDSGKQVIELRAGIIIGSGSAAFEVMRDVVCNLPVVVTPVWVKSKSYPIALSTMVDYLRKLLALDVIGSPIFEAKGTEAISYQDQMRRFARLINRRFLLIKLPLLTPKVAALWLSVVTSVPKPIASALIDGLKHELTPKGEDISEHIPLPLIPFEHAVEKALSEESDVVKSDIWGFDKDAIARWHKDYSYYPKQAGFCVETDASAESLWQHIQKVGGDEGYFFGNLLWTVRAYMDALIGGDALKKRRPSSDALQVGDYIDSWKVIKCDAQQHLSLLFGMKAPGLGRLEFTIRDKGDIRELDIRAWWHPAGFKGLLYWFAMMPAHLFIFRGMAFALAKRSGATTTRPLRRD